MSTEKEKPDPKVEEIERELEALALLHHHVDELDAYLKEECSDIFEAMEEIDEKIFHLNVEKEMLQAALSEREPVVSEELAEALAKIPHKVNTVKSLCHSLPNEVVTVGTVVEGTKFNARVSKTTIVRSYKSEALLDAHPELEEMYIDGDPVVGRTINSPILDRLIAAGEVKDEDMKPFRIESRKRAPSVKIIER